MKKILLLLIFASLYSYSIAQKIKYSKDFIKKLEQTQIDLFTPTEGKYKSRRPSKNDYQKIDHQIFSKKENLEIRYAILPFDEKDQRTQVPHIDFMRVVTSTATNENEEALISVHQIGETELKEHFNANWGNIAYFQPKIRFSDRKHCRLLGLYAEGKGMVYVFFLFDEPSQYLDNRLQALRFKTKI
jgi:hypothetical protein